MEREYISLYDQLDSSCMRGLNNPQHVPEIVAQNKILTESYIRVYACK